MTRRSFAAARFRPLAPRFGLLNFAFAVLGLVPPVFAQSSSNPWPARVFAPYVDFTAWPPYDLLGAATNTGLRHCTLAFVVADPSQNPATAPTTNIPAWGGYTAYSVVSGYRLGDITAFRARGGDAIISFGGAAGTELAVAITNAARLKTAYQSVIDTYNATWIDFDIEGAWAADHPSVDRRSGVLAALQADATITGRTLKIWLTLPVLPSGLTADGLYVVQSCLRSNVNLSGVNIMAMDYGDSAAPNPAGRMGDYAIMAATNLFQQLKSAYQSAGQPKTDAQLWKMVGVTPMIGVNNVVTEVFRQSDGAQLVTFAQAHDFGLLAFWSINRDQPGGSGITQTLYEFTRLFLPFDSGGGASPTLTLSDASVVQPDSGTTNLLFSVSLLPAATGTVSVAFSTANGTATAPTDYLATNGTLVFSAGQTSLTVPVAVVGRTNVGPSKSFLLNLTNASGATLLRSQATGTILNNHTNSDGNGGGGTHTGTGGECAISTQWAVTDAGFRATLAFTNPNATNITLSTFEFDAPYTSLSWIAADANLINWVVPTHNGIHFGVPNGWNPAAVIPAGGTLTLTFQGSPGPNPPAPAALKSNGVTVGDCGPPRFTAIARRGNDIRLAWTTTGGKTNFVQATTNAGNATGWAELSGPLLAPGAGVVSLDWTNTNSTTNVPQRFYRIRVP